MKKVLIKALSVLLVVTIFATSLPFGTLAAEEKTNDGYNVSTDMGDMSMTATNSFGEMLTQSLSEQTDEQNAGYYISNIEYEGYCALVTFVTQQDCTIRVAVYEEDTGRMVTSASAEVLATDTEAIVEFEDELPDYFVLKAFMLDENVAPLCKAYTCNEMTKMYEDFLATTVEDFPEDKVINLDESEDNNFLVMSDDTSTITTDGETNVLLSYDAETGVYTFGNIDEQIKSLQKDDIFYFDNGNVEELTFIKVGAVDIDGTTAQITEAETSIDEVFDIVKIDNQLESANFETNEAYELEDGVNYVGTEEIEESDEITTYGFGNETSVTLQHNYTLDKTIKPEKPKKIGKKVELTGSIKVEGSAGISVTGTFKFYISRKFSEVELTLTPKLTLDFSIEGVGRLEVKLKPLDYGPIYGIYVGISPKFIVEASVEASFDATLKFTLGVGYNTTDGLVNKSEKPSFKPEFKIEGEIFIGVDLAPRAYALNEKIAKVELGSEIGAKLTATISTDNGDNHLCNSCLDGDIDLVGNLTGTLVFGEKTKFETSLDINLLNIKIDIVGFYYSYTYNEFGWGECTHISDTNTENPDDDENENITDSGTCGEKLTWTFNESTGTLTISGTGEMYDCGYYERLWAEYEYSLISVIIQNGVTTIGDGAFWNCYSLTSVSIPESVKTIGNLAFYDCNSLTSITIPDSVTSIGNDAFFSCDNLTNVTIGDSVTTIGGWAFSDCYSLTSITIPDSVATIGDDAFQWCYNLTSITIGDSVTTIGKYAFCGCGSLTSVTIPDSVTVIGDYAFNLCDNLTNVYYSGTEEEWNEISIGSDNECLTNATIHFGNDNNELISGTCGENLTWTFNETTGTLTVSGTGEMDSYSTGGRPWYRYIDEIKKIIIINGVTTIGEYAFQDCTNLTSITMGNNVTTIYYAAFAGCTNLTSVTIPDNVITIDDWSFSGCTSLKNVTIGNGVTTIGIGAFSDCENLTNARVGDMVKTISDWAFRCCTSLTNIIIPDSVITVGDYAFWQCTNLLSATIGDGVTTIGEYVFQHCTSLTNLVIGNSVSTIGYCAFDECVSLTSITLGNSVTTIEDYMFAGCENLTNVIIGNSVTTIGNSAFYFCNKLTNVVIPDSVITIDDSAFYGCTSLSSVKIGDGITTIGEGAFYVCESLTDIYYSGTEEEWNEISIGSYNEDLTNATIHYNSTGVTYSLRLNQVDLLSFASTNSTDTDVHTATAQNTVVNNEYIILVLKNSADINNFTDDDILYIDQKTAEADGEISFNYVPKTDDECIVYIIGLFSDSDSVKQEQVTPDNNDIIIGDVNEDGKVNTLDRVILTRYIAKWEEYSEENVNLTAADVNGDGKVNTLDRVILTRYIAKWEGYETLPYTS